MGGGGVGDRVSGLSPRLENGRTTRGFLDDERGAPLGRTTGRGEPFNNGNRTNAPNEPTGPAPAEHSDLSGEAPDPRDKGRGRACTNASVPPVILRGGSSRQNEPNGSLGNLCHLEKED